MKRILRFTHQDEPLGELSPADVMAIERIEEINGEHALEVATTQVLGKGERLLLRDARGTWREYEVVGVDEEHSSGASPIGSYYCTWSIKPDLMGATVSAMPGTQSPVTAQVALATALSTQTRWAVGTVTRTTTGGASMYDMDAWSALGVLLENWGGELSVTIEVSTLAGKVTARRVDLFEAQGEQAAKRRYDFGADLAGVRRSIPDAPLYCRVSPRGKGEPTEGGGYGRKVTIASVNGGVDWLEYAPMVGAARIPDGSGGWQHPTLIVENGEIDDPAELKSWALSTMAESLTPKVSYEVDVLQAAAEGVDLHGVSLGDAVQVVDRTFGPDGLRVEGRVVSLSVDEATGAATSARIGHIGDTLASKLASARRMAQAAYDGVDSLSTTLSTSEYVSGLIGRMNAVINATGGYTYIVPGHGILTYSVAVSDPVEGAEAKAAVQSGNGAVVEIKGGTVRIANTLDSQGGWNWRTVFTSGHIAADVVTAANITAGFIGSANADGSWTGQGSYWNLTTGELKTKRGLIGGFTIGQTALYNGLASLLGQTSGIYLGTDGLATANATDGGSVQSVTLSGGGIQGYYSGQASGFLTPNLMLAGEDPEGNPLRGTGWRMRGDVIDLRTPHLIVSDSNTDSGNSTHAVTETDTTTSSNPYYQVRFTPGAYDDDGYLPVTLRFVYPQYINGMFVGATVDASSSYGTDARNLAFTDYVDNKVSAVSGSVSNLANALDALAGRVSALEGSDATLQQALTDGGYFDTQGRIVPLSNYVTNATLSNYATQSWVSGSYATQTWVNNKGYATKAQVKAIFSYDSSDQTLVIDDTGL